MDEPSDKLMEYVKQAVEENLHLGYNSFEKGFLSQKWMRAQKEWISLCSSKRNQWGREIVTAVQSYSYKIWKARNKALHGSNKTENLEKKKEKCRKRIKELYNMSRTLLTLEDKKLFRLPLHFRIKSGYSTMTQWIEMTEFIFQRRMKNDEKNKLTWYFPVRRTKKKESDQSGDAMKAKHSGNNRFEEEQLRRSRMKQTKLQFNSQCCRPREG